MEEKKKGRYAGALGAFLVHLALFALLVLVSFALPELSEEGGVPVVMGDVADAYGGFDPGSLVDVEVVPEHTPESFPVESVEQDLLTQADEETVAIPPAADPKRDTLQPEKTAAEREAEARRLAEERAERERKAAEEAANQRIAGAFGRGAEMGSRGDTQGEGAQGGRDGNASEGVTAGTGGYGTFSLDGRSIGVEGLPRPVYNVQDEGRVVVNITVNPARQVVATGINPQTNTVNAALRKAAEEAARKARFSEVSGVGNQTGTITYYFNLK